MRYLLYTFPLLLACSTPVAPPPPQPILPIELRAEYYFDRRDLLARAAANLEEQTAGVLAPTLFYTLAEPNVLREVSYSECTKDKDAYFKSTAFGWTNMITRRTTLVEDRLTDDELYVHVAMHEILHMVGLDHVKTESSIMFEVTNLTYQATCMDKYDARELCRLLRCDPERLHYCRDIL